MIENSFEKESDGLYRKNVGVVLVNHEGKIFAGKRFGGAAQVAWQMPQGGILDNETEEEALVREVQEEIGILPNTFTVLSKTQGHYHYVIPKKMRQSVWNNLYIGQRQRWFLAKFTGTNDDINIETEFPEFAQWKWLSPSEIVENAVLFKKKIYADVFAEFNLLPE